MDWLTVIIIPIAGLIITGVGVRYAYLTYSRSNGYKNNATSIKKHSVDSLPLSLLTILWEYPLKGGNHASWAIKESSLLV